ncbi:hypothetical protein ACWEO2_12170 [Nocardia sp. NPDC004278]
MADVDRRIDHITRAVLAIARGDPQPSSIRAQQVGAHERAIARPTQIPLDVDSEAASVEQNQPQTPRSPGADIIRIARIQTGIAELVRVMHTHRHNHIDIPRSRMAAPKLGPPTIERSQPPTTATTGNYPAHSAGSHQFDLCPCDHR